MSNLLTTYIDNFFDDDFMFPANYRKRSAGIPAINIQEFEDKYQIKVTTPGLDPKDIKIEIVDSHLNISYEHKDENVEKSKGKIIREEYSHYSFSRSISLPNNVNKDSITASSRKGILTIDVEKLPETKPKEITIEDQD